MKLYHCTTPRKAKKYRQTGAILKPVRGFENITSALAWCVKVGRSVIYECESEQIYPLPDHHNDFGKAYWADEDIKEFKCVYSVGEPL